MEDLTMHQKSNKTQIKLVCKEAKEYVTKKKNPDNLNLKGKQSVDCKIKKQGIENQQKFIVGYF